MATYRCNQQFCSKCRKHVPISTFDEHHASCTLRKCNGCNTAGIPESEFAAHRLSCITIRCPGCCQTFSGSVYLDHIALCEVRRCYRCFQPQIPQSEMAAHLIVCPMRRCPRCCKTFSKSAYDAHLAICRSFLASVVRPVTINQIGHPVVNLLLHVEVPVLVPR